MTVIAAFMLGLLSAPHCMGMCGGIAGALLMRSRGQHSAISDALHFGTGKMLGYATLGLLAGTVGLALGSLGSFMFVMLRTLAGLLLIAMGLHTAGWWHGVRRLEAAGFGLWQPALRRLGSLPVNTGGRLLTGMVWGLLPCGLVYSVLALAMTTGDSLKGMLVMLSFGAGTLPFVLFAAGLTSLTRRFSQPSGVLNNPAFRKMTGAALIIFGAISIALAHLPSPGEQEMSIHPPSSLHHH